MNDSQTHCELILGHLKTGKKINGMLALNLFGCWALPQRVFDLKRKGHKIFSKRVTRNGKSFCEYYLENGSKR